MKIKTDNIEIPTNEESFNQYLNYQVENNFSTWYPKFKDKLNNLKFQNAYYQKITLDEFNVMLDLINDFSDIKAQKKLLEFAEVFHNNAKNSGIRNIVTYKNGKFSNKFDFNSCMGDMTLPSIARSFMLINYHDLCNDVGGVTEFVARDFIFYDHSITPTIYNGLPLRTEFRVFYDFDTREVIKVVNYWNKDYVFDSLYNITDRIIFENYYPTIENDYNKYKNEVIELVKDELKNIDLIGKYSIDILKNDNDYYLIDIATAEHSAYWSDDD